MLPLGYVQASIKNEGPADVELRVGRSSLATLAPGGSLAVELTTREELFAVSSGNAILDVQATRAAGRYSNNPANVISINGDVRDGRFVGPVFLHVDNATSGPVLGYDVLQDTQVFSYTPPSSSRYCYDPFSGGERLIKFDSTNIQRVDPRTGDETTVVSDSGVDPGGRFFDQEAGGGFIVNGTPSGNQTWYDPDFSQVNTFPDAGFSQFLTGGFFARSATSATGFALLLDTSPIKIRAVDFSTGTPTDITLPGDAASFPIVIFHESVYVPTDDDRGFYEVDIPSGTFDERLWPSGPPSDVGSAEWAGGFLLEYTDLEGALLYVPFLDRMYPAGPYRGFYSDTFGYTLDKNGPQGTAIFPPTGETITGVHLSINGNVVDFSREIGYLAVGKFFEGTTAARFDLSFTEE